jgi:hypothetical protein
MKPTEFLQQHSQPDDPPAAIGDQKPPAEPQPRNSWLTEAFDWALAVGGFLLLNNYFFGPKKDD